MVLLTTPQQQDRIELIDFRLMGTDGEYHSLEDIRGKRGTLIMFLCNHCPYVRASIRRIVEDCKILEQKGIGCAAIMPNDTDSYPADNFSNMKTFSRANNFNFPYMIDKTQNVTRLYGAVSTPEFFGYNAEGLLVYRGRLDSAGPHDPSPDTKRELLQAMTDVATTGETSLEQFPSMGCSIKWKD